METRIKTGISLEKTVFDAMEKARGLISRSAYVSNLIIRAIPGEFADQPETAASTPANGDEANE